MKGIIMMQLKRFFLLSTLVCAPLLGGTENLLSNPTFSERYAPGKLSSWFLVIGKDAGEGKFLPMERENHQFVLCFRQKIKAEPGKFLVSGKFKGEIRAVWAAIALLKNQTRVSMPGAWIPQKQLNIAPDGTVRFSGIIKLEAVDSDEAYLYIQTYSPQEKKLEPLEVSLIRQDD